LSSGVIVSGSYLENAAFNPSLSPLQSALVSVVMHQEEPANIKRVVLVEMTGATITHQAETRMVLAALAPRATLEVLTATAA
jgi:cytidine deaminase